MHATNENGLTMRLSTFGIAIAYTLTKIIVVMIDTLREGKGDQYD